MFPSSLRLVGCFVVLHCAWGCGPAADQREATALGGGGAAGNSGAESSVAGAGAQLSPVAGGAAAESSAGTATTGAMAGATGVAGAANSAGASGTSNFGGIGSGGVASGSSGEPAGGSGAEPAGGNGGEPAGGSGGSVAPLGLTAEQAAAAMGRGVNLGQMFESTQHTRSLAVASAKIDAYYARGFRNVRVPVTWTEPIGGDRLVNDPMVGAVNRSHPRLAVLESVVDYALSKPDLYVIINAHHEQALKTESRSLVLEQLWKDVTDVFRSRDHRLLFEILNEPHRADGTAMPAEDLRTMTGLAYNQIRQADPQRIVLIGGNQWFGAGEVPSVWTSLDLVGGGTDPYLMATFHHYDPWTFCGNDQGSFDDAWTESNQSDPMDDMATWASTVGGGMPVFIGEWGVGWGSRYSSLTCNNIRQWYTTFDSVHATGHNQPTAVWDDGGWFKIFDHATNNYTNNLIDCIEGTCSWDGAERFNSGCE